MSYLWQQRRYITINKQTLSIAWLAVISPESGYTSGVPAVHMVQDDCRQNRPMNELHIQLQGCNQPWSCNTTITDCNLKTNICILSSPNSVITKRHPQSLSCSVEETWNDFKRAQLLSLAEHRSRKLKKMFKGEPKAVRAMQRHQKKTATEDCKIVR